MRITGLASLAFFYCDFRDDEKKALRPLLSSLLVQLCGHSDAAFYSILSDFYLAHDSGEQQASDTELFYYNVSGKCFYFRNSLPSTLS
jgi:hypothetical protein